MLLLIAAMLRPGRRPFGDEIAMIICNVKLVAMAEPTRLRAIDLWVAAQSQDVPPNAVHLFDEFTYTARSWPRAWRVRLTSQGDLSADRTSCTSFLANCMRLLLHAATYILHQQLRRYCSPHHKRCRRWHASASERRSGS